MRMILNKKSMKRLLCVALSLFLIAGYAPLRTEAALKQKYTYHVINLKPKKFVTTKLSKIDYRNGSWINETYLYKIKVPANGYVIIQTSDSSCVFSIYRSYKKNKDLSDILCSGSGQKSYSIVLPKGNCYIRANKKAKIKWTFVKAATPKNYCRAKATAIKKGKKMTAVFHDKYEFPRWYKLTLTSNRAITVTAKALDGKSGIHSFEVVDSRGVCVETTILKSHKVKTKVLPKGTYYICLSTGDDYGYYSNRVIQLTWN